MSDIDIKCAKSESDKVPDCEHTDSRSCYSFGDLDLGDKAS